MSSCPFEAWIFAEPPPRGRRCTQLADGRYCCAPLSPPGGDRKPTQVVRYMPTRDRKTEGIRRMHAMARDAYDFDAPDDDAYLEQSERTRDPPKARGGQTMAGFLRGLRRMPKPSATAAPVPVVPKCVARSVEKLGLRPSNRQDELTRYLLYHRAAVAAHGVGTGKTLLAVLAAECALHNVPDVSKVVVLTPLSLINNFYEALDAYGPRSPRSYKVITYDDFVGCYRRLLLDGKKLRADLAPLHRQLKKDFGNAMLVIDEAHNMRTEILVTKRSKTVHGVQAYLALLAASHARRVLMLTATPVVNGPYDVANLVAMAHGDPTPYSRAEWDAVVANPKALGTVIAGVFSFVQPGGAGYPSVTRKQVRVVMTKAQQQQYERFEAGHLDAATIKGADPTAFYSGLRQAVNLPTMGDKAAEIIKVLKRTPAADRRAIVYSTFLTNGIKVVQRALTAAGFTHSTITGAETQEARAAQKAAFDDGDTQVMLLSEAGAEGLSFKGVRLVFGYEPLWHEAAERQFTGRAIRFQSHAHLPKAKQTVAVYQMRLVKEDPRKRAPTAGFELSADDLIAEIAEIKNEENAAFVKRLQQHDVGRKGDLKRMPVGAAAEKANVAAPADIACEDKVTKRRRSAAKSQQRKRAGSAKKASKKASAKKASTKKASTKKGRRRSTRG